LDILIGSGGYEHRGNNTDFLIRYYQNDGKGNFESRMELAPRAFGNFSCIVAEDFDGDGDLDLVIGNRRGQIAYYQNEAGQGIPNFQLVTTTLGNVDVRNITLSYFGYSVPQFFQINNQTFLICGSEQGDIFLFVVDRDYDRDIRANGRDRRAGEGRSVPNRTALDGRSQVGRQPLAEPQRRLRIGGRDPGDFRVRERTAPCVALWKTACFRIRSRPTIHLCCTPVRLICARIGPNSNPNLHPADFPPGKAPPSGFPPAWVAVLTEPSLKLL
jgi:hypothetical protein